MTEKFDIIAEVTYRYNSDMEQQDSVAFNDTAFQETFMDTQELLTINVSQPIKRIMKFYNINMGIPESFVELDYNLMTNEEKITLDNFISINTI